MVCRESIKLHYNFSLLIIYVCVLVLINSHQSAHVTELLEQTLQIVYNRWTGLVYWTGGLDSWTRALDASDAAITLVIAGVMYFADSRTCELSWK